MGAGAVGGSEIQQPEAREELAGLGVVAGLEMGLGDLELRRAGQQLVMVGVGRRDFQRRVDHAVEARDREAVRAHGPQRPAELKQRLGRAGVVREFLQKLLVDGRCLREPALPAVHAGQPDEGVALAGGEPALGEHLAEGHLGRGVFAAFGERGGEAQQAGGFRRGVGRGGRRLGRSRTCTGGWGAPGGGGSRMNGNGGRRFRG